MAVLGMMIGGTVVNAVAFTGSGYLYKTFDKNGYEAEMKRHNLAQERLDEETTKWEENRLLVLFIYN
jgi:hypothetical protein